MLIFIETPNDGGGDGTDNRPINGEPELACIVQDQEMEEGMMNLIYHIFYLNSQFRIILQNLS